MLLPSMTSKRIACGPPFHNFTFYSIPRMAQRKKRLRDKPLSLFREVLLYPYRAHRAGVGGVHGQRHLVGRDVAGDGDSQSPLHLVYQSPAHWVQPMQSSGSTNAFMLVLPPFRIRKGAESSVARRSRKYAIGFRAQICYNRAE